MKKSTINPARLIPIPSVLTEEIINAEYGIEVYYNTEQKVVTADQYTANWKGQKGNKPKYIK